MTNEEFDKFLAKIGSDLTLRFIDLGVDYLVLEQKTGMSRAKIKRIFCGTQDFKISELIKICDALNISLREVIKRR